MLSSFGGPINDSSIAADTANTAGEAQDNAQKSASPESTAKESKPSNITGSQVGTDVHNEAEANNELHTDADNDVPPDNNSSNPEKVNSNEADINTYKPDDPDKAQKEAGRKKWYWWVYRVVSAVCIIAAVAYGTLYAQWQQQDVGSRHYPSNCNYHEQNTPFLCPLEGFNISGGIPVRLKIRNCRVDFFGKTNPPGITVQYSKGRDPSAGYYVPPTWNGNASAHDSGYWSDNTTLNESLIFEFEGRPDSIIDCRVLIFADDKSISDLTVEVEDSGLDKRAELSMTHVKVNGLLNITGAAMNFRGREVVAGDVSIHLERGTVDFSPDVEFEGGKGITIIDHAAGMIDVNLADGDIVIAPDASSQIDLLWDQPCGYVCLPGAYWVDDSSCRATSTAGNGTNGTNSSTDGTTDDGSGDLYAEFDEPYGFDEAGVFQNETLICLNNTYLFEGICVDECPANHIVQDGECVDITRSCQARACSGNVTGIYLVEENATLAGSFFLHRDENQGQSRANDRELDQNGSQGQSVLDPLVLRLRATVGSIYVVDTNKILLQEGTDVTDSVNGGGGTYDANSDEYSSGNGEFNGGSSNITNHTIGRKGHRQLVPQLSDTLSAELNPLLTDLSEFDDTLFRIKFETYEANSLWLGASKEIFIEFEPGYLNAFSATLLKPKDTEVSGRLYPGFCPHSLPSNAAKQRLDRNGLVSDLLRDGIATFNDNPARTIGHKSRVSTLVYTFRPDGFGYNVRMLSFTTNKILTAAIVLSLIIALGVGVGSYFFLGKLYSILVNRFEELAQANQKALQFQKMQAQKDNGEDVDNEGGTPGAGSVLAAPDLVSNSSNDKDEASTIAKGDRLATAKGGSNLDGKTKTKAKHALPRNPYQLLDQFVQIYRKSKIDSLDEFTKKYFEKEWPLDDLQFNDMRQLFESELDTGVVLLTQFEADYRKYCMFHHFAMKPISGKHISTWRDEPKYAVDVKKEANSQTEVYTNIVWKKKSEWTTPDGAKVADDDTINLFLDHRCDPSIYKYDFIFAGEFRTAYKQFCFENKLSEHTVREEHMESLGHRLERRSMHFVSRLADESESENTRLADAGDATSSSTWSRLKAVGSAPFAFLQGVFYDSKASCEFYQICGHVIITLLVPLPLLAVGIVFEESARKYALAPEKRFVENDGQEYHSPYYREFSLNAILIGPQPETLDWATSGAALQNQILFYMALMFYLVSFFELIPYLYYFAADGNDTPDEQIPWTKMLFDALKFIARLPYTILLFFFVMGPFGYLGLVLVWSVLAAIINPFKYLPMAAGTLTLITAIAAKLKTLSTLQKRLTERVKKAVQERCASILQEIKGHVNSKINVGKGGVSGKLASSGIAAKLGDLADALPVDIEGMARLAQGDIEEIKKIAGHLGLEPLIAQAIVATARQNIDEQKEAVRGIASRVGLDPELAAALVGVVVSAGHKASREHAMKLLMEEILRMIEAGKIDLPFNIDMKQLQDMAGGVKEDLKVLTTSALGRATEIQGAHATLTEVGVEKLLGAVEGAIPPKFLPLLQAMPSLVDSLLAVVKDGDFASFVETVTSTDVIRDKLPIPIELLNLGNAALQGQGRKLTWLCIQMMVTMVPVAPAVDTTVKNLKAIEKEELIEKMRKVGTEIQKADMWGSIDSLYMIIEASDGLKRRMKSFLKDQPVLNMLFVYLAALTKDKGLMKWVDPGAFGVTGRVAVALMLLEGGLNQQKRQESHTIKQKTQRLKGKLYSAVQKPESPESSIGVPPPNFLNMLGKSSVRSPYSERYGGTSRSIGAVTSKNLPIIISDGMILPHEERVTVWVEATWGSEVTVKYGECSAPPTLHMIFL